MNKYLKALILAAAASTLAACGGGSSGSGASTTGTLNLGITDAPVDGALSVNVTIDGISIKRTDGSEQSVTMNGKDVTNNKITVNLLDLQNGKSAALLATQLTSGDYQWIRFHLASANICFMQGTKVCYDLQMPTQDELKTSGSFTVPSNGVANITVDWNLRQSIVQIGNSNTYRLKPVLHLKNDANVGSISGAIVSPMDTYCSNTDTRAVYVYTGTVSTPGDLGGNGTQPIATVDVQSDNSFYIGMLDPGTYTLAFTCDAAKDDPTVDDSANMTFPAKVQADVTAGQPTTGVYIPGS